MLYHYDIHGNTNWASQVKHTLLTVGFGDVWNNQGVSNPNIIIVHISQRLKDIRVLGWHTRCVDMSKLITLHIKMSECEYYLNNVHISCHRRVLSLLRCCSHNLQVEMVRHTGIEYQNRLCVMCNMWAVEDEYKFTLVCPFDHSLRKCYIPH
jgi:hypothetical protein